MAACVTTRRAWKIQLEEAQASPDSLSGPSSPLTDASNPDPDLDLPSPSRDTSLSASSSSKRPRRTDLDRPRKLKKRASTSAYSSRSPSRADSHLDVYRSDRSRSTSVFPPALHVPFRDWCSLDDGSPGDGFVGAADVVRRLAKSYKTFFRNPGDPDDTSFDVESLPTADLEYPNSHANEKFMLLAPKDKDHYNPIMCLEQSLYTIVEFYLTPAQRALFGSLPTQSIPDDTPPPSPLDPCDLLGPLSVLPDPPNPLHSDAIPPNHLRSFQRAIRRRDGPLFLSTLETINHLLRSLKYPPLPSDVFLPAPPNELISAVRSWSHPRGVPDKVVLRVVDETYQRCVGPNIKNLHRYEAFSSEVYGELMPSFTSDIIAATGLNASSLLLDLGSGVGNVLLQASLQTGCRSYGIELLEGPANVARQQWKQFQKRCRMWGVRSGQVELEEGDMLKSKRVTELMGQADVVLVNNKVFQQSLNEALRAKFLDLKEGAIVVSLKPFVSPNARVTERNVDDICAIFDVVERPYRSGSVSWGSGGGTYYLHRVDRVGYANVKQRFENLRARSARRR